MKDFGLTKEEILIAEDMNGVESITSTATQLTFTGKLRGVDIAIEGTGEEIICLIESVISTARRIERGGY